MPQTRFEPQVTNNPFTERLIAATEGSQPSVVSLQAASARVTSEQQHSQPRRLACLVTHGMGQQVPFETLALVAEAFGRGERKHTIEADRVALMPDSDLQMCMRVCFEADEAKGLDAVEVEVFEAYWAPLTEGKISFVQSVGFLLQSGLRALLCYFLPVKTREGKRMWGFNRWVFGDIRAFTTKPSTLLMLVATMLLLLLIVLAGLGSPYAIRWLWEQVGHTSVRELLQHLWTKSTIYYGGLILLCWLIGYWVRYAIVEFGGDVVIYVSSFKVSAFQEIRDAIQKRATDIGKQIVQAQDPKRPGHHRFDGLIFVGHSLGSVISYDLINALLVWDVRNGKPEHHMLKRMQRFITFGSPLDKTAYLFRNQVKMDHHYREQMAGNMQPLILDYTFRTFPWVNLYTYRDVVSGKLAYYDWPVGGETFPIRNVVDPQAWIPLIAHTQYWKNKMLTDELLEAIKRR